MIGNPVTLLEEMSHAWPDEFLLSYKIHGFSFQNARAVTPGKDYPMVKMATRVCDEEGKEIAKTQDGWFSFLEASAFVTGFVGGRRERGGAASDPPPPT